MTRRFFLALSAAGALLWGMGAVAAPPTRPVAPPTGSALRPAKTAFPKKAGSRAKRTHKTRPAHSTDSLKRVKTRIQQQGRPAPPSESQPGMRPEIVPGHRP